MKRAHGIVGLALGTIVVAVVSAQTASAAEQPKAANAKGKDTAPLGSPDFYPSPAHPIGWRGDSSGCYPGANPPTTWSCSDKGERKNVAWVTKLPCYSWATPIIVGNKLFVRSDPYDLICLNKADGKILWIRSHGPQIAVTPEERKDTPAFAQIDPLVAKLKEVNDAFVAQGWTAEIVKQKHDLQHQINEILGRTDKKYKLPSDQWCESWSSYTGSTPCSDGQFIYFTSFCGVTACYDLDGNLKWQTYQNVWALGGEHGEGDSPALAGDKFISPQYGPRALDKATGKEVWKLALKPANASVDRSQTGMVSFAFNGADYVISNANVVRLSDGASVFKLPWIFSAPSVHDNIIATGFFSGGANFYKLEPSGAELKVRSLLNETEYGIRFPDDAGANHDDPMANWWASSPVFHNGLLYCLSNWGKLVIVDSAAAAPQKAIVLNKNLPFDLKNPKHRKTWGCGIGASPCIAGKYLYLTDNAGCTLVLELGPEGKVVAKNNIDHIMETGWEEKHWNDHYHEVTLSTPIFEGNRIYIRGEQFLYCIGEK